MIYYSDELGLGDYINVAVIESKLTENEVVSITADVFESLLGAIFLDQGIEFAKKFIAEVIFKYIDEERIFFADYKSAMKEYADANDLDLHYEILDEYGYPHAKTFIISIVINGEEMGVGQGKNKKEGEQAAAKVALEKFGVGVLI